MITPIDADFVVQEQLDRLLGKVAQAFKTDALGCSGALTFGTDTVFRRVIEARKKGDPDRNLTIVLTTVGGIVEVVQRIVAIIRHHYDVVNFVIPDFAFSAGTVLVMSGDTIYMDYFSRLGPIDPQIERGERLVPALGYCERYQDLIKESGSRQLTDAELAVLISSFDQAELHQYEQARDLSVSLLQDWLVRYKFKNWDKTEMQRLTVTPEMKKNRATEIALILNDTKKWHSHAGGISAQVLRDELNLKIDDLNGKRKQAVDNYHSLLDDYMRRRGHFGVLHMRSQYMPYHVHGVT
jgi:hypothetical protein